MMKTVAVLVASDSCFNGEREDKSGKAIVEIMKAANYKIESYDVVSDDLTAISAKLNEYVNREINLVLTTGGTGFSSRDNMPEATKAVIDREAPGIAEAIRFRRLQSRKGDAVTRRVGHQG